MIMTDKHNSRTVTIFSKHFECLHRICLSGQCAIVCKSYAIHGRLSRATVSHAIHGRLSHATCLVPHGTKEQLSY